MGYLNDFLLIPMFTIIILETRSDLQADTLRPFQLTNLGFCALFFFEWLLALWISPNKRAFLTSGTQIINLVSCVPFGFLFQGARVFRLFRIVRVFRLAVRARRYRGKGRQLLQMLSLVGSTVLAGALALQIVEPNTGSHDQFSDALWWSLVTVSTVGYGDVVPVTGEGKIVAAVLIIFGVGIVGYTAGFMTSILDSEEHELERRAAARLEANVLRILEHLDIDPVTDQDLDG